MAYKLLLADDSVTIQRVIELTFADEDIQVVAVSDGEQAIARVEADPPDIVLADVAMPGRDGYEVAAHLKQSPRLAHIPVVLLTGAFEPVDRARFDSIGCDGVLAKPFEPQQVIGRVRELLTRERAPIGAGDVAALAHSSDLQSYFDRLDEALANAPGGMPHPARIEVPDLPSEHPPLTERTVAATVPPPAAAPAPASAPTTTPAPATVEGEPPASEAAAAQPPRPPAEERAPEAPVPAASSSKPAGRPTPPKMPPLADAFAALLAAEQGSPLPSGVSAWPAIAPPVAPVMTDELIEQVSRRVLERLTNGVLRDTVADIVSAVAERLVREEIERLKASVKDAP